MHVMFTLQRPTQRKRSGGYPVTRTSRQNIAPTEPLDWEPRSREDSRSFRRPCGMEEAAALVRVRAQVCTFESAVEHLKGKAL
jgi:hypothetical protein